jgi:alpha-tubulin suppressor-like RCC1 family protein
MLQRYATPALLFLLLQTACSDEDRITPMAPDLDGAVDVPQEASLPDAAPDAAIDAGIATPPKPVALAVSAVHSCARFDNGSLKCWGRNALGELGQGDTAARGDMPGELGKALHAIDLGTGHSAVSADVGGAGTCAVLDDGSLKCWGSNFQGFLGQGDENNRGDQPGELGDALHPVDLGAGRKVLSVSLGSHVCALLDGGKLKCWGDGRYGALGLGDSSSRGLQPGQMGDALPSIDVGAQRSVRVVSTGNQRTCAVLDDGALKCWGNNALGTLGVGLGLGGITAPSQLPDIKLGTGLRASTVDLAELHSCALVEGGKVKCWGSNARGELGLGDTVLRGDDPSKLGDALPVVDLGAGVETTAIALGSRHSCALLKGGAVKCWGVNDVGQLGLGDTQDRGAAGGHMGDALPKVDLGPGAVVTAIAASGNHTCALLDDHSIRCWGDNQYGQLGIGDTSTRGDGPGEMGAALPAVML